MYHFTECDLNFKSVAQLKDAYSQIGCTLDVADKRVKANWVQAILAHQSAQIELVAVAEIKVDEQAVAQKELETHIVDQSETVAPEIHTVEISFFDHEVHALGKQIASITHDPDDFQTQRWVVTVGETEIHRADSWAKCHSYITWHYKQGTLPFGFAVAYGGKPKFSAVSPVAIEAQVEVQRAIPGYDFCLNLGIQFKQRVGSETGTTYWYAEANHYYNQPGRQYKTTSFPKLEGAVAAAVDYLGKCGVDVAFVKQQLIDRKKANFQAENASTDVQSNAFRPASLETVDCINTIASEQAVAQEELNEYVEVQAQTIAPEIEVDSDIDPDFGELYRVWISYHLLGTFYRALDGSWVAQPARSNVPLRCATSLEAQAAIVTLYGMPDEVVAAMASAA